MKSKLSLELIWIVFTFVLVILVLLPIYNALGYSFPFYTENIIFVVAAVTFLRYIFLLRFHWLADTTYPKVVIIFLAIPVIMYLVDNLYDFQAFLDEEGIYSIMHHLDIESQRPIATYIRTEMLFFWTAATLSAILLPIRMMVSLWRQKNRGTV